MSVSMKKKKNDLTLDEVARIATEPRPLQRSPDAPERPFVSPTFVSENIDVGSFTGQKTKFIRKWVLRGFALFCLLLGIIIGVVAITSSNWIAADISQSTVIIKNNALEVNIVDNFLHSTVDWNVFRELCPTGKAFKDNIHPHTERVVWTGYDLSNAIISADYTWNDFKVLWKYSDPTKLSTQAQTDILSAIGQSSITSIDWNLAQENGIDLTQIISIIRPEVTNIKVGYNLANVMPYITETWGVSQYFIAYDRLKPFVNVQALVNTLTRGKWSLLIVGSGEAQSITSNIFTFFTNQAWLDALNNPKERISMEFGISYGKYHLGTSVAEQWAYGSTVASKDKWPNTEWTHTVVLLGFSLFLAFGGLIIFFVSWWIPSPGPVLSYGTITVTISALFMGISLATFPVGLNQAYNSCNILKTSSVKNWMINLLALNGIDPLIAADSLESATCSQLVPATQQLCMASRGPYDIGTCTLQMAPIFLFIGTLLLVTASVLMLLQWRDIKRSTTNETHLDWKIKRKNRTSTSSNSALL